MWDAFAMLFGHAQATVNRFPRRLLRFYQSAVLRQEQRPVYAALFEFETKDALSRLGGQWTKLETVGNTTFWQLQTAPAKP